MTGYHAYQDDGSGRCAARPMGRGQWPVCGQWPGNAVHTEGPPAPIVPVDGAGAHVWPAPDIERIRDPKCSELLNLATGYRRAAVRRAQLTTDELATAAARFGIVAGPIPANAGGPESFTQRMAEAGDIWVGLYCNARRPSTEHGRYICGPQLDAAHDAHTERELLAGRVDADGRTWDAWPPIYTEGALARPDLLRAPSDSASQRTGGYPR